MQDDLPPIRCKISRIRVSLENVTFSSRGIHKNFASSSQRNQLFACGLNVEKGKDALKRLRLALFDKGGSRIKEVNLSKIQEDGWLDSSLEIVSKAEEGCVYKIEYDTMRRGDLAVDKLFLMIFPKETPSCKWSKVTYRQKQEPYFGPISKTRAHADGNGMFVITKVPFYEGKENSYFLSQFDHGRMIKGIRYGGFDMWRRQGDPGSSYNRSYKGKVWEYREMFEPIAPETHVYQTR